MTQLQTLKTVSKAISEAPCMAFIAGGAPRDIDNGKPYKDIDIFALYEEDEDMAGIIRWFSTQIQSVSYVDQVPPGNEYEQNFNGIHSVHNLFFRGYAGDPFNVGSEQVQLILQKYNPDLDPIRQVVNRFDLSTSQITMVYNPENERYIISKTEGYSANKQHRILTLTQYGQTLNQEQLSRSYQRSRRISMKLGFANTVPQFTREELERRQAIQEQALGRQRYEQATTGNVVMYHGYDEAVTLNPNIWNMPISINNWPTRAG